MGKSRKTLKGRLFQRDGWIDGQGRWRALCAFGCGRELGYDDATIDHYPKPQREGGSWTLKNTRLACQPCNGADGAPLGSVSQTMPEGLNKRERRRFWRAHARGEQWEPRPDVPTAPPPPLTQSLGAFFEGWDSPITGD